MHDNINHKFKVGTNIMDLFSTSGYKSCSTSNELIGLSFHAHGIKHQSLISLLNLIINKKLLKFNKKLLYYEFLDEQTFKVGGYKQ
ncbi:MAG: hypothetical protein GY821_08570 [Gammaproteobacteria bacterium]|nr:hypothetical protein [Gammaproteobacteria bacterium]